MYNVGHLSGVGIKYKKAKKQEEKRAPEKLAINQLARLIGAAK